MRVSKKLELIGKIGRELQAQYTFDELYGYLLAFGVPRLKDGPTNSKWSYTKLALASEPDDKILRIAEDLNIEDISSLTATDRPRNWEETSDFRLFLSHISTDKDKALRLKEALSPHAINAFVAHEDIHPTRAWQQEIECALATMEAMVAIHTEGFSDSYWTQQEIGYALGRGVKVISLKMGEDPKGFISIHQALPRRNRNADEISIEIAKLLEADMRTKSALQRARKEQAV